MSDQILDPKEETKIRQAKDKLWRMGNLSFKLKGVQKTIRDNFYSNETKKTVILSSRRLGKTFVMMVVAVEYCLRNPNSIVKVIFPKKKDARGVARDQMKVILDDCPSDLVPEWKEAQNLYMFPNGSEIQMTGTDGGSAESVRGSRCHLAILDEAGFHDYKEFTYIIQSIIMPTLLTTKGKMILASTPSKQPDHPFMTDYVLPARKEGKLIEYTIYDNPLIEKEDIEGIASEYPRGIDDPDFQREFLLRCDIVDVDSVIPEFDINLQKDIVKECTRPNYYNRYVSGDPAVTDLTVILFGYYDFLKATLVIEDELVMGGQGEPVTTLDIVDGIRRKEKMLYSHPLTGEVSEPKLRIMDNNNKILIHDLYKEHGLHFIGTAKDNKEAQINKLRMMLKQGRIIIHPRCKNLIFHLQTARWKTTREGDKNGFMRVKGSQDGSLKPHHADALDALIYMIRNINETESPFPTGYNNIYDQSTFFSPKAPKENSESLDFMKTLLNIKKTTK